MSLRSNLKTPMAIFAALALVAVAAFLWLPNIFPVGKSLEMWLETRVSFFRELQLTHEALRDVEYSHHAYLIGHDPQALATFKDAAKSVEHHISMIKGMRPNDMIYGEKIRSLSTRAQLVLDQLRNSAATGASTAQDQVRDGGAGSRELREISREIASLEEDEFQELKDKVTEYNSLIGPYPWLTMIMVFGLSGGVFLFALQSRKHEGTDAAGKIEELTTELGSTKEQLERLTKTDSLTEVLNARGLERVLSVEDNRIGRSGGHVIAILINCDNFKKVNDELGIATGDAVLKDIARRIVGTLRPSDHVARVGGDEFLTLLPDTQLAYGLRVAERIRMAVSDNPLHSVSGVVKVTVSLGVAMLPLRITSVEEAITLSRTALKRSKQTGKNKVSLAREGAVSEEPATADEIIETLLDVSNFRSVFQPIIDLASEEVAGFEIFSRGPDGAFESPADLFRTCIENDILTKVDLQCLRLCIEMAADVADNMRVHVNLFPSTIFDTPIDDLIALFPENKGNRIFCVEISEQQFIGDPNQLRDHLSQLKQSGILVAIDDIGFGRSSLETLIMLEPDVVKVDRTYVTGVANDKYRVRLLKRLTNVAKSLGAEVVAEGVESRDDLAVLQELGIHFAQGFLWGELLQVLPANPKEQRTLIR